MKDKSEIENDTLRIGDYVLFKDVIRGCTLSVEGILLEDLTGTDGVTNLQDAIFCVHLMRQYSASRDLNAFLENYSDVRNIEDEGAKRYLTALERGQDNERKLNDNYMRKKYGQKVSFGEIIQLFHVKSGKYLVVVPDELATDERENTHVMLDPNGNAFSWLQVCPRFKIDKDGDQVLNNAEIYLKVAERTNEFIHIADRDPLAGHSREVNCALEPTSWRLNIYQSSLDSRDSSILLASQLVYINDPETRSNLTIALRNVESLEEDGQEDEEDESPYRHDYGDLILEPAGVVTEQIDSNFLWFIEASSMLVGGPIKWKTDQVRFKHMNTGLYLKTVSSTDANMEGGVEFAEETIYTTTTVGSDSGTLFSINELNSTSKYLSNAKALQIGQAGVWIERGELLEDSVSTYMVKTTRDKVMALSLIIHRFSSEGAQFSSAEDDEGTAAAANTPNHQNPKEPLDVYTGLSARNYLQKYLDMTVIPKTDSVDTIWPSAVPSDRAFFELVIKKAGNFAMGFPISSSDIIHGIDKADASLCTRRQNLLREQKSLKIVLQMINKLIPITEKADKIQNSTNKPKRKKSNVCAEERTMIAMGQDVLQHCFSLLYFSILNNQANQMYVADHLTVLLAHLNTVPLAGQCVTEMLSKNMELQETKITTTEIQIFVDKLRSSKMNAMYLQLLQACCSCQGEGVDGNQCKVANMLFSDTNDIIIELHADYSRSSVLPVDRWKSSSLYIPDQIIPGSPLRGDALLTKGLPQLSLAWTTNSIDFSPLGLFGKLSVNIEDLYRNVVGSRLLRDDADRKASSALAKKSKKKSSEEQKLAVANYFIAEMFLGAEMCMDRNYIAMHKLDHLFPYEVLVSIIKFDVHSDLKAAAVRLLMCLHVDRDPQASSKIPCLTRTYSDIKKNAEPQLPYVDVGRRYTFGLIQQMVSEHVQDIVGKEWQSLSRHMLKMLRTLVEFNFYGTNDKMKDVIAPLIRALDRSQVVYMDNDTSPQKSKKAKAKAKSKKVEIADSKETIAVFGAPVEDPTIEDRNDTDRNDFTKEFEDSSSSTSAIKTCLTMVWNCFHVVSNCATTGSARVDIALENKTETYKVPTRYSRAPMHELETMVEAVTILDFSQRVIEDRNISLLLRGFYEWESGSDKSSPSQVFDKVVEKSSVLSLDCISGGEKGFNAIMLDVLMYVHMPLVQSTLEVMMAHHSLKRTLLDNAENVQLLASHKRERQYKMVDQMLQLLEQNAETHELWGELENDADRATSKQTHEILKELIDTCRVRRFVLEFDEEFMADAEIQNLYRNLGCFEICMKVLGLLDSVDEDIEEEDLSEVERNTRDLCLQCNNLLYWFFLGNDKNQVIGYDKLTMFLENLDRGINSHLVIRAIFKMNEALMRRVPHSHLADLVERIVKVDKSHHYLALFAAIPNVGEKNLTENQFEIVKTLTSPGRLQKVSCFLVPVDHPDYNEKRELMAPFLNVKNVSIDDLPKHLAYHLMFLEVLSGCTVGRLNVTTVEAKVQSVFNYEDIIASMLDSGTILLAKIILGRFLFNAVIEVELQLPGLEKAHCIWRLLESFLDVLADARDQIDAADKLGWESEIVHRQKIEYIVVAIKIIGGFFFRYYDSSSFRASALPLKGSMPRYTKSKVNDLIVKFFHKIKDVHDLDSPRLSDELKASIFETLDTLKKQGGKFIHSNIQPKFGAGKSSKMTFMGASSKNNQPPQQLSSDAKKTKDESETKLIDKYCTFLTSLRSDSALQDRANNENVAFITILEALPMMADKTSTIVDVRYESLIRKLVSHIRENIKIINNQKRLDARVTKTSAWIIRAFRTMIENKMGMSIYERDDDGGAEQDEAAAPVVNALNSCGATALCLDLIADGIDETLQLEAVRLGVGLLFKEGGALEVQKLMHNHLSKTSSDLFFKQVRLTLKKLEDWHDWNKDVDPEEAEELETPDSILIVRFLQLMCEGHFLPNQDIMREQPNNTVSYNLLDSFVSYLNCLSRIPCKISTAAAIRLSATILEVIQGPCEGNQKHFALDTELVESLNRLNRAKFFKGCIEDDEIELKKTSIDIFQGLLEGQGEKSVVYERVLSVIHLDIIQMMSKKLVMSEMRDDLHSQQRKGPTEDQIILQTECVVLLQMLCNFKPSLYDELGISKNVEDIVGSGTAMIEIIWRGDIHRRFFHVPNICEYLAKSSKDNLVENVDRSNAENKLIDFLSRSHELYREVKHQQWLTEIGLSRVFSRQNQNTATWITFVISIVINALFLTYYSYRTGSPEISPTIDMVTSYLNYLQVAVSFFTLLLWLTVRSPVNYQTFVEDGCNPLETILYTATDPLTMYYVVYLVISILGAAVENYYCSLLLLDIVVKNSTTRDVLNSIVAPRKQLAAGLLLEAFVIYIYSFYIFFFFRTDIDPYCNTLYDCLKLTFSYGFQNGGGVGDVFTHSTGGRLVLDLSFFCVVLVILLNVIFGMIIDTFSSLRSDKLERLRDTTEVCFICSIDKQVFDRASDEPDGFKTHIGIDHNMWNYLYFIFMLWEQDKDDDDGLEQYVRRAIEAHEISWIPMNKAMRLEQVASGADIMRNDLTEAVRQTEATLSKSLDDFQADVSVIFAQLMHTLKQEQSGGPPLSALLEFDDMFGDDMTAMTQSTYEGDHNTFGKHVSLAVVDVEGLGLSEEDLHSVCCKIVHEDNVEVIQQLETRDGNLVVFASETLLPVFDNVFPQDRRDAHIQIMLGLPGSDEGSHFLGEVEIHAAEFVAGREEDDEDEHLYTKRFVSEEGRQVTVRFVSKCQIARGFGREDTDSVGGLYM